MIVTLVPFILAASVGISELDWKYGPEMIYDVKIDDAAYKDERSDQMFWYNITSKLHCRPKPRWSLSCQFNQPKNIITETNDPGKSQESLDETFSNRDTFDDGPFELKFDSNGLEKVIVSSLIDPSKLDTMRAVVAQLNVGANFPVIPNNEFEIMENFTTGTCKTKYTISSRDNEEKEKKLRIKHPYEIVMIPNWRIPEGEIKEIQRTRNLENCLYRVNYIFDSREGQRAEPKTHGTKIETSKSHMIISQKNFVSWTENIIITNKVNTKFTVAEKITLTLDEIVPANGPLPTIRDSSSASIFPTRLLHDDSSEEKNDFS